MLSFLEIFLQRNLELVFTKHVCARATYFKSEISTCIYNEINNYLLDLIK